MDDLKEAEYFLLFLALSKSEKLSYLPGSMEKARFHLSEADLETENPLLLMACLCVDCFSGELEGIEDEGYAILRELRSVLALATDSGVDYIWNLKDSDLLEIGKAGMLWEAVERLAKLALVNMKIPRTNKPMPFDSLIGPHDRCG